MCLLCDAEAIHYGEIAPGWFLEKATIDADDWLAGMWALVQQNQPSFVFTKTPIVGESSNFETLNSWINEFEKYGNFYSAYLLGKAIEGSFIDRLSFYKYLYERIATCIANYKEKNEDI